MASTTSTIFRRLNEFEPEPGWRALVERFHGPLVHFVRGLNLHQDDAEDVAQDTLVVCFHSLRDGHFDRSNGRLSTWLFGIALRVALNTRRRLALQRRHVELSKSTTFWASVASRTEDSARLLREWKRAVAECYLEQARAQFEPTTFRAFELVVRGGWKPADVAANLGISVKSVYNAKHRVLNKVRALRDEHENAILRDIA